jgi:membrane-associated phospholipid phosphatase
MLESGDPRHRNALQTTERHSRRSRLVLRFGWDTPVVVVIGVAGRMIALACALITLALIPQYDLDAVAIGQRLGVASILLVGALARHTRSTALVLGYVFVFLVFVNLRPIADETALPVHYTYPIIAERILFLGSVPTVWLQELFYVPGRIGAQDAILAVTYVTYFFAPHLAAVVVCRTRPDLFPKAVAAIALTFLVGLVFYFAIPTAPPWLASERGDISEEVHRVMPQVSAKVAGDTYEQTSAAVGVNDVAAMPSLHTALTAIVALIAAQYGRWGLRLGVFYVTLMGLALVYLGEHYVVDELAGVALAVVVWRFVARGGFRAARRKPGIDEPGPAAIEDRSLAA